MSSAVSQLFPDIEPYARGLLEVGDGQRIYWEVSGNPDGKPALVVHGGPGSGGLRGSRRLFDPAVYRVVLFDQRGCGESVPHASDPAVGLAVNTTEHLIADMELLRVQLGVERWLLYGGSWGSTLILAYAERFPERVSEVVLAGVTTTSAAEIDWLYRGVGLLLPQEWEAFRDGVPEADRDGDLVAAYRRLVNDADAGVRAAAVRSWCAWEDAVIAHESSGSPGYYGAKSVADQVALVRICTHYFAERAWLAEGQLLREAHRLAGIAATLVHGRLDLAAPLRTAWELSRVWPSARLRVIENSGHTGGPEMRAAVVDALAEYGASGRV
ncbi:prolyl aminopeptidase [Nocardia terpenica]|uniref:prolyl aminopeptidase n=1 Tax=Nocardia terpenica TaxID=455432 RepID=UPI002FE009BF